MVRGLGLRTPSSPSRLFFPQKLFPGREICTSFLAMIPCVFTSTFLTIRNSLHVRSLECQITLTQLKPHFQTDSGALSAQSAREHSPISIKDDVTLA